jgi:hypothetical protein
MFLKTRAHFTFEKGLIDTETVEGELLNLLNVGIVRVVDDSYYVYCTQDREVPSTHSKVI